MDNITVGAFVRSHDFERIAGRPECYVEGVVDQIVNHDGLSMYSIKVTKRVFSGEVVETKETHAYAPVNGTPTTFGGVTNGVELLIPADFEPVDGKPDCTFF